MKINNLKSTAVYLRLPAPLPTSSGTLLGFPLLLLDVETDSGIVGRAYLFCYDLAVLKSAATFADAVAADMAGLEMAPQTVAAFFDARFRLVGLSGVPRMLQAGLDMAAWDALAQRAGLPLVELLGGSSARSVPAYYSCFMRGVDGAAEDARIALERGFQAVKIKLGYARRDEDIAAVKAIRELSADLHIMVDYNQSLDIEETVARAALLQDQAIYWLEEPVAADDFRAHRAIKDRIGMPLQTGENWWGLNDMHKCLAAQAASYVMPDALKIGGVSGWMQASTVAEEWGCPISSHLYQEVSVHLLAAATGAHWLEYMDFTDVLLREPLAVQDGVAKPGARLQWNDDAVREYAIA